MNQAPPPRRPFGLYVLGGLLVAGVLWTGFEVRAHNRRIDRLEQLTVQRGDDLEAILGEVTRIRIEQSADGKGPNALLEMLRTYAPILVSARTPEPDYDIAREQMTAVIRAFESLGEDAWKPVMDRIAELDPAKNFDELKWLLEAAVAIDEKPGLELARKVLLGQKLPAPRLRWYASEILLRHNPPLAQATLRQVLLTESSRGVNPERAAAYGLPIPDHAAVATSGFHNFVTKYVRSGDEEIDETLLMVMGRTEHDLTTVQECVKALGERKCAAAAGRIKELYRKPPGFQHNPLFQVHCLNALADIEGEAARPFFEQALDEATTETVRKRLETLLAAPIQPKAASVAPRPNAAGNQGK